MIISNSLLQACSPHIARNTIQSIVKTESKGNPLALSLNHGKKLLFQPHNKSQAIAWTRYLENHKLNFDIGLTQINVHTAHRYGYRAEDMLDPCKNLKVSQIVLQNNYKLALKRTHNSHKALMMAISAYNTGNYRSGFYNGYVRKVVINAD